jgi:hypothetical protein
VAVAFCYRAFSALRDTRDVPAAALLQNVSEGLELPGEPTDYHFLIQSCAAELWKRNNASSATLEPVTAPAGARAAHLRQTHRPVTTCTRPATPRFAATSRLQGPQTELVLTPGTVRGGDPIGRGAWKGLWIHGLRYWHPATPS